MRIFFDEWSAFFQIRPLPTDEMQIEINYFELINLTYKRDFNDLKLNLFLHLGFTHHYEILAKAKSYDERLFYIERAATEFWSVQSLRYHFKNNAYLQQKNFFQTTLNRLYQIPICGLKHYDHLKINIYSTL